MTRIRVQPTGRESPFREDEIIVSKTDLKGRLTYANDVFLRVSGFTAKDVVGQPHSIIRHPDMPRTVFKLLWETIEAKAEIFAYVLNMASNGDHYWVLAHVTPSFDAQGKVVGYHSNRRKPHRDKVEKIIPIYQSLLAEEAKIANLKEGMLGAYNHLMSDLSAKGIGYDEFVLSL
ncbi:MAG: PAS domain-containing protein [Parvibaculum sp.]|uniref:PAS domain-containing protein n=1 Tax=Parvibaculum sp. TaxID=2024848 RepID=UPI0025F8AB2C|nr:PAS domain-containing protein [Parvibaculum sp.]MCE9649561.1 PAS domain-containing protein [Parvibaculum sp.]